MTMQAIATAADTSLFTDASIYEITYVGSHDQDSGVRWGYLRDLARKGTIAGQVICRNRDGSDAGRRSV